MNKENLKESILRHAAEEFSSKGVAGARMDSIAKKTKCNKAMLHYYFGSKELLYKQTLSFALEEFHFGLLKNQHKAIDLGSFLEWVIGDFLDYHSKNPQLTGILVWELASGVPALKEILKEQSQNPTHTPIPTILNKLEELIKKNEVRINLEPMEILLSIGGLMASAIMQSKVAVSVFDHDREQFLKSRKESIIKILLPSLKGGGSS